MRNAAFTIISIGILFLSQQRVATAQLLKEPGDQRYGKWLHKERGWFWCTHSFVDHKGSVRTHNVWANPRFPDYAFFEATKKTGRGFNADGSERLGFVGRYSFNDDSWQRLRKSQTDFPSSPFAPEFAVPEPIGKALMRINLQQGRTVEFNFQLDSVPLPPYAEAPAAPEA